MKLHFFAWAFFSTLCLNTFAPPKQMPSDDAKQPLTTRCTFNNQTFSMPAFPVIQEKGKVAPIIKFLPDQRETFAAITQLKDTPVSSIPNSLTQTLTGLFLDDIQKAEIFAKIQKNGTLSSSSKDTAATARESSTKKSKELNLSIPFFADASLLGIHKTDWNNIITIAASLEIPLNNFYIKTLFIQLYQTTFDQQTTAKTREDKNDETIGFTSIACLACEIIEALNVMQKSHLLAYFTTCMYQILLNGYAIFIQERIAGNSGTVLIKDRHCENKISVEKNLENLLLHFQNNDAQASRKGSIILNQNTRTIQSIEYTLKLKKQ